MKQIFSTIIMAAAMFSAITSCQKEGSFAQKTGNMTFKASLENEAGSLKTSLDMTTGKVSWTKGDCITILWEGGNTASDPLAEGDIAGAGATFHASAPEETQLYAVYPSVAAADFDGQNICIEVPAIQNGDFASTGIMAAKCIDGALAFRNVCGMLSFSVPDGVDKVVITTDGTKALAGKMSLSFENGVTINPEELDGKNEVEVSVNGAGVYYAGVIPSEYAGLCVSMFKNDVLVGDKQTFKNVIVGRNQVKLLGELPASSISGKYFVTPTGAGTKDGSSWDNAADFAAFKALVVTTDADGKSFYLSAGTYTLTAEIKPAAVATFSVIGGFPATSTGTSLAGRNVVDNPTIFDGAGKYRIFVVTKPTVTWDGLVFQNGYKSSTDAGTTLILEGCGDQTFNNCKFLNCNHASTGRGGVMRVSCAGKTVSVMNCLFEENEALADAGAVLIAKGTYISRNTVYRNNKSTVTSDASGVKGGGAVCLAAENASITASFDNDVFEGNTASTASAIYAYAKSGSAYTYTVKCNNCVFKDNESNSRGCVRGTAAAGKIYLNACAFYGNKTGSYGSVLQLNNPAAVHNCVLCDNENSGSNPCNIYHTDNILISNTTIRCNEGADATIGVNAIGGSASVVVNSIISSTKTGAAITVAKDKTVLSYGHNLYKTAAEKVIGGTGAFTVVDDADHNDAEMAPELEWAGAPEWVLKWNSWPAANPPAGFVLCSPARVEAGIDAFDTATSMGVKEWLNSLGTLNTDRRGVARNTSAIWPGSYDCSATSSL